MAAVYIILPCHDPGIQYERNQLRGLDNSGNREGSFKHFFTPPRRPRRTPGGGARSGQAPLLLGGASPCGWAGHNQPRLLNSSKVVATIATNEPTPSKR